MAKRLYGGEVYAKERVEMDERVDVWCPCLLPFMLAKGTISPNEDFVWTG